MKLNIRSESIENKWKLEEGKCGNGEEEEKAIECQKWSKISNNQWNK